MLEKMLCINSIGVQHSVGIIKPQLIFFSKKNFLVYKFTYIGSIIAEKDKNNNLLINFPPTVWAHLCNCCSRYFISLIKTRFYLTHFMSNLPKITGPYETI